MSDAFLSSVVCLAARARSKGISSFARTVMESVADSLRASPNFGQWRRSSTTCLFWRWGIVGEEKEKRKRGERRRRSRKESERGATTAGDREQRAISFLLASASKVVLFFVFFPERIKHVKEPL